MIHIIEVVENKVSVFDIGLRSKEKSIVPQ